MSGPFPYPLITIQKGYREDESCPVLKCVGSSSDCSWKESKRGKRYLRLGRRARSVAKVLFFTLFLMLLLWVRASPLNFILSSPKIKRVTGLSTLTFLRPFLLRATTTLQRVVLLRGLTSCECYCRSWFGERHISWREEYGAEDQHTRKKRDLIISAIER